MINYGRVINIVAVTALAAAAAIAIPPATQPGADSAQSNATTQPLDDRTFINEAARGGLAEVTLGRLAVSRATSPQVKEFGQAMVDDHSQANSELLSLAMDRGIKPPPDMAPEAQVLFGRLSSLKGSEFDQNYINAMVDDHRKDIALFKHETETGQDAVLKAWADRMMPLLNHHLEMAVSLQKNPNQPPAGEAMPAGLKQE